MEAAVSCQGEERERERKCTLPVVVCKVTFSFFFSHLAATLQITWWPSCPDQTFNNFRASDFVDRWVWCSSELSIGGINRHVYIWEMFGREPARWTCKVETVAPQVSVRRVVGWCCCCRCCCCCHYWSNLRATWSDDKSASGGLWSLLILKSRASRK